MAREPNRHSAKQGFREAVRSFLVSASSYAFSESLFTLVRLDILRELATDQWTPKRLAHKKALDQRGCAELLAFLASQGVLTQNGSEYSPSPLLKWASDRGAIESLVHWLRSCQDYHALWTSLSERLRIHSQKRQLDGNTAFWKRLYRTKLPLPLSGWLEQQVPIWTFWVTEIIRIASSMLDQAQEVCLSNIWPIIRLLLVLRSILRRHSLSSPT
jgi:hypothetical protein